MDIRQDNGAFAAHFGLRHNPFAAASSFQFYKPRRRPVLEQLIHFSRYSQLLLAVTGPRGSGKTVLRHAMAAASKESALNVVVSALKYSDAAGVAQQLAHALQVTHADVMSLLNAVEQSVLTGKDVQLLVDDAEALDESALLLLQRLAAGNGQARCKVFLFGEPALQSLLQDVHQAADGDGAAEYHLIELEPWTAEEVEEYLQKRLQDAGRDLDLFTDQELGIVLERGQGWPGVINQQAQELLLERLADDQRPGPAARGRPVLPYRHLAALLAVTCLLVFAWYQLDDDRLAQTAQTQAPAKQRGEPATPPVVAAPQQRIMLDLPPAGMPQSQSGQPAGNMPPVPAAAEQTVAPPQPEPESPQAAALEPAVASSPAVPPSAPRPAAVERSRPEEPVKEDVPATPVTTQSAPERPQVAATVAARQAGVAGNWYAAQPEQSYTVQIFATASEQNARQFVQRNGESFHYFRKVHQGRSLFVVTYGRFDSSSAARAAIERLPESLRNNQPWPRTFASIRAEMR